MIIRRRHRMYQKPEMILFDYGQTLTREEKFNPVRGTQALLKLAKSNPNGVTALQIQELADALSSEIANALIGDSRSRNLLEVSNYAFNRYLYEYYEVEFAESPEALERIFWDNAALGRSTENIEKLLMHLQEIGIRTGVISNITAGTDTLTNRINELIPDNQFEFILASSDYIFRKPHRRIFEMALAKAKLSAEQIWFCGDNPICDVEGAYNAGMKPVWYTACMDGEAGMPPVVPHLKIDDWEELIHML
jgi:putative hydrolase of the HAD superfamily